MQASAIASATARANIDAAAIAREFGDALHAAVTRNVESMLAEDVGTGDLSAGLIARNTVYEARIIAREQAILCGAAWFDEVMRQVDPAIEVLWQVQDGDRLDVNATLVSLRGPARSLLTAERSGMNFIQMLSGVSTVTSHYVEAVRGTGANIVDTRKTIPGLRLAQKYAIRIGGGTNHRLGLFDAILLKENHLTALGGVAAAIEATKPETRAKFVQVEVETLEQLDIALAHGASSILLDNFSLHDMAEAARRSHAKAVLEASGNVNLASVRAIAETGVDRISIGALTKDIRAIDLSMRFL